MAFTASIYWNWGYPLAIILSMILGHLWYGPFFNDIWMQYNNFSVRSQKKWKEGGHGYGPIIKTLCSFVIMATVVQYIVFATNCLTALDGLYLGAILWAGFAMPLAMVHYAFNPRGKRVVVLIDLTYQLSYFLIQSAVIAHFSQFTNKSNTD